MSYEYKVVPAPARGLKAKGLKTVEDRFANALETAMNELAGDGWEYLRADTLPCEQREGIMGRTTVFQNLLVFRREKQAMVLGTETRIEPKVSAPVAKADAQQAEKADTPGDADKADDAKKPSPDVAAE